MNRSYDNWLNDVRSALASINMPMDDWQKMWPFDFSGEFKSGKDASDAAAKANRFWWHEQNKSLKQDCLQSPNCWLPKGHQGKCEHL